MALSSAFQSVQGGVTTVTLFGPFTLPAQVVCVPTWATDCYVIPSEKIDGGNITVRCTNPAPPEPGHGLDYAVTDSGL